MQQKTTHKLNSEFAADFHLPAEIPLDPGTARGFGRGQTIAGLTCLCLLAAALFNCFFSMDNEIKETRGIGYVLIVTGGSFLFGLCYHIRQGINIPWSVDLGDRFASQGEFDRRAAPGRFWLMIGLGFLFFGSLVAGGVWLMLNAALVSAALHR